MSATAKINSGTGISTWDGIDNTQSLILVSFQVVPSNTPANYLALGDILDLTPLVALNAPLTLLPFWVDIKSYKAGGDSGFVYRYLPGTTLANGKFQVLTSNGAAPNPLLDLGAGAYPAGVTGDTIIGIAMFVRL